MGCRFNIHEGFLTSGHFFRQLGAKNWCALRSGTDGLKPGWKKGEFFFSAPLVQSTVYQTNKEGARNRKEVP